MKKIITLAIIILASLNCFSQAQTGGEISGKSATGTRHTVGIDSSSPNRFQLSVSDSTSRSYLSTLKTNNDLPQGSAAAGVRGQLILGKANTVPPAFSDGLMYPLPLSTHGAVWVELNSGAVVDDIRPTYTNGDRVLASVDTFGQTRTVDTIQNDLLYSINAAVGPMGGDINTMMYNALGFTSTSGQTITTQNLVPAGTATANSAVEFVSNGNASALIYVSGTYTGALSLQYTIDDAAWLTVNASGWETIFRNVNTNAFTKTIASGSTGIFEINIGSAYKWRITALAAVTGTATIWYTTSNSPPTDGNIGVLRDNLSLSQGGTTSGKYGPLTLTATTTGSPTYANGTTNPPSTTTTGALRVCSVDSLGNVVAAAGGTQYAENATTSPATGTSALMRYKSADPTLTNGQMAMPQLTDRGEQRIAARNRTVYGTITTQNLTSLRTATAGSAVELLVDGYNSASIKVDGTYTGALSLQGTLDDTVWVTLTNAFPFQKISTMDISSTISSADTSMYQVNTYNLKKIRVTGLAAMTGTARVNMSVGTGTNSTFINNTSLSRVNVTIQGATTGTSVPYNLEDAASANAQTSTPISVIRADTMILFSAPSTSANGDWANLICSKLQSLYVKDEEKGKRTYSTSFVVTSAASATDIFELKGSSTKKIGVTNIKISGTQTAAGIVDVYIKKRSSANTGGTSTTATCISHDATDVTATATGTIYTANPTTGTSLGDLRIVSLPVVATTDKTLTSESLDFGIRGKPVYLNSATEALAINLNGVTVTGGSFKVSVEWTEE
jgi:hypothetical protein